MLAVDEFNAPLITVVEPPKTKALPLQPIVAALELDIELATLVALLRLPDELVLLAARLLFVTDAADDVAALEDEDAAFELLAELVPTTPLVFMEFNHCGTVRVIFPAPAGSVPSNRTARS